MDRLAVLGSDMEAPAAERWPGVVGDTAMEADNETDARRSSDDWSG